MITEHMKVGGRYMTHHGMPVGPVEFIDVNGWAWIEGQCWNASSGRFYANIEDHRDLVEVIPEADFENLLPPVGSSPPAPNIMAVAS